MSVEETSEWDRQVELTVDDVSCGVMTFASYLEPSISMDNRHIAIWGSLSLYIYDTKTKELSLLTQDDEVHDAYWSDEYLLLVRELSLVLLVIPEGKEVSRHDHGEIIISSQWVEDTLIVNDLQGYKSKYKLEGGTFQQICAWQSPV